MSEVGGRGRARHKPGLVMIVPPYHSLSLASIQSKRPEMVSQQSQGGSTGAGAGACVCACAHVWRVKYLSVTGIGGGVVTHPFTLTDKAGLKPVIDGWFRVLQEAPEGTETAGWPHKQRTQDGPKGLRNMVQTMIS